MRQREEVNISNNFYLDPFEEIIHREFGADLFRAYDYHYQPQKTHL